jgi:hypothetical protein
VKFVGGKGFESQLGFMRSGDFADPEKRWGAALVVTASNRISELVKFAPRASTS